MNITDLYRKNEKLQETAVKITSLIPDSELLTYTTIIMRGSKRINAIFPNLLSARTEMQFGTTMDKLEDEIDEVLYGLDGISNYNRNRKIRPLEDFIKYGYDVLSLYSFACDKIIESRLKKKTH